MEMVCNWITYPSQKQSSSTEVVWYQERNGVIQVIYNETDQHTNSGRVTPASKQDNMHTLLIRDAIDKYDGLYWCSVRRFLVDEYHVSNKEILDVYGEKFVATSTMPFDPLRRTISILMVHLYLFRIEVINQCLLLLNSQYYYNLYEFPCFFL